MGTRYLTMVVKDNKTKVAQYGQFDGYLDGAGKEILNFLRRTNIDHFKESLDKVSFFTEKELDDNWAKFAKSNKIDPKERFVDFRIIEKYNLIYPQLNREMGCGVLQHILDSKEEVKFRNDEEFAKDSLFCEYAYVIDLDRNVFEVYTGFNKELIGAGSRFFYLQDESEEYKPVTMIAYFDFDKLPSDEEFLEYEIKDE